MFKSLICSKLQYISKHKQERNLSKHLHKFMNTLNSNVATATTATTAKNGEKSKSAKTPTPQNLPKIEAAKRPEMKIPTLPPIAERLKKLERIQQLVDRREVVLEALENLNGFYVAPDGNGCNLRFQDSKGKTFGIAHPSVIGEMVSLAKGKLSAEIEKLESQIDFSIM